LIAFWPLRWTEGKLKVFFQAQKNSDLQKVAFSFLEKLIADLERALKEIA